MQIHGFMHCYSTEVGCEVSRRQIARADASGLFLASDAVHLCVVGPTEFKITRPKIINSYDPDPTKFEGFTLTQLYEHALSVPDDTLYWYVHTKGASHGNLDSAAPWRDGMEECVIDNWQWCTRQLQRPEIGSTGPMLHWNPRPFWAGNFWWSKASHVKTLVSPQSLIDERLSRNLPPENVRYIHEEWITQGQFDKNIEQETAACAAWSYWDAANAPQQQG